MIVRISGEGQWELADSESDRLNELERVVIAGVPSAMASIAGKPKRSNISGVVIIFL